MPREIILILLLPCIFGNLTGSIFKSINNMSAAHMFLKLGVPLRMRMSSGYYTAHMRRNPIT